MIHWFKSRAKRIADRKKEAKKEEEVIKNLYKISMAMRRDKNTFFKIFDLDDNSLSTRRYYHDKEKNVLFQFRFSFSTFDKFTVDNLEVSIVPSAENGNFVRIKSYFPDAIRVLRVVRTDSKRLVFSENGWWNRTIKELLFDTYDKILETELKARNELRIQINEQNKKRQETIQKLSNL